MSSLAKKLFGDRSEEEEDRPFFVVGEGEETEEGEDVTPSRSGRSKQQIDHNYNRRNNKRPNSPVGNTTENNKAKTRKMGDQGCLNPVCSNTQPVGHSPVTNKTAGRQGDERQNAQQADKPAEGSDSSLVDRMEAFMASMKQGLIENIDKGNNTLRKEITRVNKNVNSVTEGLNQKVDDLVEDLDNFKKKTDGRGDS